MLWNGMAQRRGRPARTRGILRRLRCGGPVVKWYGQSGSPGLPRHNCNSGARQASASLRGACARRSLVAFFALRSPDVESRLPPIMAAPALHNEFLSIASGVSGYLAKPTGVPGIGVVVMMEAYGLNAFVKGVCERFARAGYMALAPDIYHGDTFDYK